MRSNPKDKRPFQGLKILQWNAGGLSHEKRTQLLTVCRSFDIDVFVILEANFAKETLNSHNFGPYDVRVLPKSRQIASGILNGVRNNLISTFKTITTLTSYNGAEIAQLDVWKRKRHYRVYACYSPSGNSKLDFSLLSFPNKTILCGDFNAHSKLWKYNDINSAGKVIMDLLNSAKLELLFKDNDIPTYLHYNGNGTNPDLTLVTSDIAEDSSRQIIYDPGSGHRIIITGIKCTPKEPIKNIVKNRWNYKKANWVEFSKDLEETFCSPNDFLIPNESIDKAFDRFQKIIV